MYKLLDDVADHGPTQVDGTEDGIKMTFGDNGVSCKLSKRLPDYVKTNVADFVDEVNDLAMIGLSGLHSAVDPAQASFMFGLFSLRSQYRHVRGFGAMRRAQFCVRVCVCVCLSWAAFARAFCRGGIEPTTTSLFRF